MRNGIFAYAPNFPVRRRRHSWRVLLPIIPPEITAKQCQKDANLLHWLWRHFKRRFDISLVSKEGQNDRYSSNEDNGYIQNLLFITLWNLPA